MPYEIIVHQSFFFSVTLAHMNDEVTNIQMVENILKWIFICYGVLCIFADHFKSTSPQALSSVRCKVDITADRWFVSVWNAAWNRLLYKQPHHWCLRSISDSADKNVRTPFPTRAPVPRTYRVMGLCKTLSKKDSRLLLSFVCTSVSLEFYI